MLSNGTPDTKFQIGDVVMLKSGGPRATVTMIKFSRGEGEEGVWCELYYTTNENVYLRAYPIHENALEKVC